LKDSILSLCERLETRVISVRRALHRIPEASFAEHQTQARVCSYLKEAGIEFRSGIAKTGILGIVGGPQGRTIALRADMDGLSLTERTGLTFASRNPGFMHACGHDAHMAMVLGAGIALKRLGTRLPGKVKLLFQPSEETAPGGALGMIKEGVLKAPKVGGIIGLHVDPMIPVGKVAVNAGPISASADDFRICITGRGGHGSAPQDCVDAIVAAAHFITALQTVVSRRVSALDSVVVSIGKIKGGDKSNIVADRVEMEGTIRTKSEALRRQVPRMITGILRSTCSAFKAKGEFEYIEGYPPLICDLGFADFVRQTSIEVLGRRSVIATQGFEMGGEDFAYFAREVPGVVVFVGVGNKRTGKIHRLHHPQFDIDEKALKIGMSVIAYSAYRYLCGRKDGVRGKGI
jgi:amidohydrolase